jgi:hypothetical protein
MTVRKAQDPGPIELTENQRNPYLARPEEFCRPSGIPAR